MAFENRQHMNGFLDNAIDNSIIAYKYFAHFVVGSFRYDSSCHWSLCGFTSAFPKSFDPSACRARVVPRDKSADVQ